MKGMKLLNTYKIQFTKTVGFYKKKLQPLYERTKQVFAENETQAIERAYHKLMVDYPDSSKKNDCRGQVWAVGRRCATTQTGKVGCKGSLKRI